MNINYSGKKQILTFLAVGATGILMPTLAKVYEVKGVVTETATGNGCPAAMYRIYSASDTILPVVSNITDTLGRFVQPLDSAGDYRLVTEFMGTRPGERIFTLTEKEPSVDLDTIPLSGDESTLSELVVTYRKPLIESDGNTLTYNMEEDPMAKSNNVLEMLRKVPLVTVDAEDNVKVKGSSSFKILVNGKEDPMFSTGNISTVLKAMPASTIKKIEVINEPGAKYDAEGTAGILNIVTVGKQNLEGVFGNVNAWLGKQGTGGSAYIRTKIGKVAASINGSYFASSVFNTETTMQSDVFNETSDDNYHQHIESSRSNPNYQSGYGNLNISWEPDTLNLFTASANISNWKYNFKSEGEMWMKNLAGKEMWSSNTINNNDMNSLSYGGQLSYQHTFRKEGHYIVASYQIGGSGSNYTNNELYTDAKNLPLPYRYLSNLSDGNYLRHIGQIDYALPITDKHLFEAGAKFTAMSNTNLNYPIQGESEATAAIVEGERRKTRQFQDIFALYASYRGKFGDFTGKAGVRYEYTDMGLQYLIGNMKDFSTKLNDVVPNLSLSYNFTPASNLRLGYQMRISRPGLWQLNPYRLEQSVTIISYGNPDLESERSHNLSLSYSNYGGKLGGSAGLEYYYEDNGITEYTFAGSDGKIHTTNGNIGRSQQTSLNFNLNWTIINNMDLSLYAYGYYKDIKADTNFLKSHRHGWGGNFNVNWNYRLPYSIRLSANGGGGSGWFDLQWKGDAWYYYGVSASKSFLKNDALTFTVNASNFLNPWKLNKSTTTAEGITRSSTYRYSQWGLSFSVSWQFGSLRSDVKRTAANVSGDDSGSGGGEGGGRKGGGM